MKHAPVPCRLPTPPVVASFALVLAALLCAPMAASQSEGAWQRLEPQLPGSDALWETTRPPAGAFDRIRLHRYPASPAGASPRAVVLYLPGTNMNGAFKVDVAHDPVRQLAAGGVEVYALDYRTHAIPPSGVTDFGFLLDWTLESFNDDALTALALVRAERPEAPVIVAGFSRGASLAANLACTAEAGQLAGVALLDGHPKSVAAVTTPSPANEAQSLAAARAEFEKSGRPESDVAAGIGWEERDRLMKAVSADPHAPATDGKSSDLGEQLAGLLYGAWGPGRLAHPIGAPSGLGISRPDVLAGLLEGYDRYYPNIQNVEGRLIAEVDNHPDTPLDDCWGSLGIPLIWFGTTGMGHPWLLDGMASAVRSGASSLEVHVLEGYGHLDLLVAESAPEDVYAPLLRWIERHSEE